MNVYENLHTKRPGIKVMSVLQLNNKCELLDELKQNLLKNKLELAFPNTLIRVSPPDS